jgi:type I restriction enzyme M protein
MGACFAAKQEEESDHMSDVVQKLWGFCHTLRHDGIDYGDYIEQITFLLFLKMADEKAIDLPKSCDWPTLREESGSRLTDLYADLLRKLGKTAGILGDIYAEAQSRFNNPVNLKKLINLIDETEWTTLGVDVKAKLQPGGQGQRRLFQQGLPDRAGLDL